MLSSGKILNFGKSAVVKVQTNIMSPYNGDESCGDDDDDDEDDSDDDDDDDSDDGDEFAKLGARPA